MPTLCLAWSLTVMLGGTRMEGKPTTITMQDVQEAHNAWRSSVKTLVVEGEMLGQVDSTPSGILRRSRLRCAASAQLRYAEYQHLRDGFDWTDDVDWHQVYIRPDAIAVFWPVNCSAEISHRDSDPGKNGKLRDPFCSIYMRCAGWWPPRRQGPETWERAASDLALVPCFVFASNTALVAHTTDEVDGRSCVVVTASEGDTNDKLWLDPERRFVLVRRQTAYDYGVEVSVENSRFREMLPGISFPHQVRQVVRWRNGKGGPPHVKSDATFCVQRMVVNTDVDRDVIFNPPAGAILHDRDTGKVTFVPRGQAVLENLVRVGKKEIVTRVPDRTRGAVYTWPCAATLIAVVFLAVATRRLRSGNPVL